MKLSGFSGMAWGAERSQNKLVLNLDATPEIDSRKRVNSPRHIPEC
jgi:hypothetical protein